MPGPTRAPATQTIDSPVGALLLAATDEGLTHVLFRRTADLTLAPASAPVGQRAETILADTVRQLGEYFDGTRRSFDVPLAPSGTRFQLQTWRELREVAYGETSGYGDLARRIGRPGAARAVGSANGSNPISIIVPCHRVIGADGTLTGYGGGLDVKEKLLRLEGATGWKRAPLQGTIG